MVKMLSISAFPPSVSSTVAAKVEGSAEEGQLFSVSSNLSFTHCPVLTLFARIFAVTNSIICSRQSFRYSLPQRL